MTTKLSRTKKFSTCFVNEEVILRYCVRSRRLQMHIKARILQLYEEVHNSLAGFPVVYPTQQTILSLKIHKNWNVSLYCSQLKDLALSTVSVQILRNSIDIIWEYKIEFWKAFKMTQRFVSLDATIVFIGSYGRYSQNLENTWFHNRTRMKIEEMYLSNFSKKHTRYSLKVAFFML